MAKHLSGRQTRLNVGITSFTETQTVVQVTGRVGIGTTNAEGYSLYVNGPTNIVGPTGFGTLNSNNLFSNSGIITTLQGTNIFYNGIGTIGSFIATNSFIQTLDANIIRANTGIITNIRGTNLNYTGVSTFTNGPLFVGTGSSTGTANQKLQVTSNAYISGNLGIAVTNPFQPFQVGSGTTIVVVDNIGNLGIGTTNPLQKLHVLGNVLVAAGSSTGQHITQKAYELNGGTLSWEGNAGQLFSITNNLAAGSLFAVNDISGIPSIDVNATGTVSMVAYGGNVAIGSTGLTGTASQQLQVNTGAYIGGSVGIGSTNPTSKLYVVGDALITGIVTSTTGGFRGQLTGVSNYTYIAGFSSVTGQAGVATISAVAGFATVASIAGYSSVTGTAGFSSFTSIAGFATITAVAGFASVSTQAGVSTIASVAGFATVSTFAGVSTFANISGVSGFSTFASTSGFSTFSSTSGFSTVSIQAGVATIASVAGFSTFASTSGFATVSTQAGISTSVVGGVVNVNTLQVTGISTFSFGPVLVGGGTSTGTANQLLQVVGVNSGAYIGGSLGIGSTNPTSKLFVVGDEYVTGVVTAIGGFRGQLTGVANYSYLAGFSTVAAVAGFASVSTFAGVSTIASVAGFSTVASVAGFATVSSIAGFSTVAAVAGFATVSSQAGVSTLASYAYAAGIATVAIQAGFATNVIGGIGSVTSLTVSGISTLSSISVGGTTGINQYVLTSTGLGLSWQSVTGIGAISGINIASDVENSVKYIPFVNVSSGTTASQYVSSSKLVFNAGQGHLGIGSTNPNVELSVIGDAYISGVVSATTFYGNFVGAVLSGAANYAFSAGFSTVAAIAGFSTVAAVAGFATVSTVAGVATFSTLAGSAGFATVSTFAGVSTFANIASVAGFSTFASTSGFATVSTQAGVSTIASVAGFATVSTQAGVSTNVSGGIANVTSLNVSGVSTLGFITGTSANFTGIVSAVDGRLISGVGIQSGGIAIGTGVTTLNFIGLGNTFLLRGSTIDISIQGGGGGGGSLSISTSVVPQFQYLPFVSGATTSILGISALAQPLGFIPSTGNLGIGTSNPTTALQVQGTTQIQTSVGSTQSVWTTTLDSKSGSANNVSLLVQPETVYNFDASQTASRTYDPVVFSNALTSASIPYTPTLYSLQNYTNVALTTSNASANISAFGFSNTVYRNSTTDLGLNPAIRLYGINNSIVQGTNVAQSVVTGYAYGNYNAIDIQKARASTIYGDYNSISVGTLSNYSAFSNYAYGFYSTLGTGAFSGTGIGTVTNFYAYYATGRISATGRVENYYGLYLATPSVTGIITNRYSIYSEDTSALMYHAGSIGIGLTNPTSKLTVQGNVLVSGVTTSTGGFSGQLTGVSDYSYIAGFSSVTGTAGFSTFTSIAGFATVSAVSGFSTYSSTSGFSSITTQAAISTSVVGGVANITALQVSGISTFSTGAVIIGTGQTSGLTSTTLQVVGVTSSAYIGGNVGIGTTDLSYRLNVNGDINSSGAIRVNGRNILDDAVMFAIALG